MKPAFHFQASLYIWKTAGNKSHFYYKFSVIVMFLLNFFSLQPIQEILGKEKLVQLRKEDCPKKVINPVRLLYPGSFGKS